MAVLRGYVLYLVCCIRSKCKQYILHFQREVPSWRASADPAGGERELLVRKYREDGSPVRAILSGICPRRKVFANTVRVRTEKRIVPCRDAGGNESFSYFCADENCRTSNSGEKPLSAGADGGRDRPVVPLHVQDASGPTWSTRSSSRRDGLIRDAAKIAQQARNRRHGAPGGHSALRPPDRTDGRGGAHGRGGRSRHDRHQFRLPGEARSPGAAPAVGHDARRAADGRDDAPDRRGGPNKPVTVKTRLGWDEESKNIVEIAVRLQDVGDRRADDSRAHARPDVPRRGRLDADRRGEAQSAA